MRAAFKEWAVVVDALGQGDQMLILRKGGISEGPGGFQVEHSRFLLFPTLFHQQRESVVPSAQARFDDIAPDFPPPDKVRLQFFAETVFSGKLHSLADANALRGQHVWRDEVIARRFDWGREQGVFALAVRVFRLPQTLELPARSDYAGCKSWVELDREITADASDPVLSDTAFETKLNRLRAVLGEAARASAPSPPSWRAEASERRRAGERVGTSRRSPAKAEVRARASPVQLSTDPVSGELSSKGLGKDFNP